MQIIKKKKGCHAGLIQKKNEKKSHADDIIT